MSIVIVVASCASGIALVLILIGVAGAVRCRHVGRDRHRRTSGGASSDSKRLSVNARLDFPKLSPVDAAEVDGDIGLTVPVSPATELVDCTSLQQQKHRREHVMMNGIKASVRSRRCSDESSVCIQVVLLVFLFSYFYSTLTPLIMWNA